MSSYGSAAFKSGNIFHAEKLSKREKAGDCGQVGKAYKAPQGQQK